MARIRPSAGATTATVYVFAVSPRLAAGHLPAASVANTLSFALFYAIATCAVFLACHVACRAREQRLTSVAQQNELAVLTERARQSRIMHDSVLQALEGLAHAYVISACDTRKLAGIEAVRLRAMLTAAGGDPATSALLPQLRYVAREFSPLAIEIVELDARSYASQYPATPVPTIAAVGGAVREALNNVAKHASCAQVTVSITTAPDGALEVMVRDHGVGFDAAVVEHGFGLSNSVIKRVTRSAGAPTSGLALVPAPASPLLHRRRLDERPGRCTDNRYGTFAVGKLHDRVEAVPVDSIGAV